MTETSTCGTVLHPEDVALEGPLSRRLTSVGRAETGMEVRVVDEAGRDVARDGNQIGEAILRGETVMKEYWNRPHETAEALNGGWFYTGDLATMDEDGYLYIVDRKKDIIISGGINISAREVEEVVSAFPAVAQCAVIGVPHEEWERRRRRLSRSRRAYRQRRRRSSDTAGSTWRHLSCRRPSNSRLVCP